MNKKIIERHIWLHQQLMNDQFPNASNLSRRFSTSKKTGQKTIKIYQDEYKIYLEYIKERHGYYLEDKLAKGPDGWLNQNEWLSLIIAEKVIEGEAGAICNEIGALIKRFQKNISHSSFVKRLKQCISCNVKIKYVKSTVFFDLLFAILNKQVLTIKYGSPWSQSQKINNTWDLEISQRKISPQHLIHENSDWIIVSWCHERKDMRNFRPSRIVECKLDTAEQYIEVPHITLKEHITTSFGAFKGKKQGIAKIVFSPHMSLWAFNNNWHPKAVKRRLPNRQLELHLPFAKGEEITNLVLSFGDDATLLEPEWLKHQIRSKIKKMEKNYSMGTKTAHALIYD